MPETPKTVERKDDEAQAGEAPRADTQELPVLKKDMKKAFRINEIFTVVVAIATAAGALLGGYKLFVAEARAAGAEEAASVKKQAEDNAKRIAVVENSQKDVQIDMRELYKAFMYNKRSERLEKPPPQADGGTQ